MEEAASNPRTVSGKAQVARTRTEGDLWSLVAQCGAHCWANMEVSKRQVNPNPKRTHLRLCPLQTRCENANSRIYVGLQGPELPGAETDVGSTPHRGLCLHSTPQWRTSRGLGSLTRQIPTVDSELLPGCLAVVSLDKPNPSSCPLRIIRPSVQAARPGPLYHPSPKLEEVV